MSTKNDKPEEVTEGPIPEGFIPDADKYMLGSAKTPNARLMPIGGRIMMNLIREQMLVENIISIHGVGKLKCILVVDYTIDEIIEFMKNARLKMREAAN